MLKGLIIRLQSGGDTGMLYLTIEKRVKELKFNKLKSVELFKKFPKLLENQNNTKSIMYKS